MLWQRGARTTNKRGDIIITPTRDWVPQEEVRKELTWKIFSWRNLHRSSVAGYQVLATNITDTDNHQTSHIKRALALRDNQYPFYPLTAEYNHNPTNVLACIDFCGALQMLPHLPKQAKVSYQMTRKHSTPLLTGPHLMHIVLFTNQNPLTV